MQMRVIALDVGGTSIKSAIIAPQGEVVSPVQTVAVDSGASAPAIIGALAAAITRHLEQCVPAGLALGFPGPFDYDAGISRITGVEKFEALYGLSVRQALRERLGLPNLPIRFRNDAEAAIVGEARYGAGKRLQRLIGVTLGTGFGSAFVVAGKAVGSGPGVPAQGWLYPVLFRGARADDHFSRRGLVARLQAAGRPWADVQPAAEAARKGDAVARTVFEGFGADLGELLTPFAVAFEAEAVLVGGRIAGALDLFTEHLQRSLPVPVLAGERGAEAALLGAAELIFGQQPEGDEPV